MTRAYVTAINRGQVGWCSSTLVRERNVSLCIDPQLLQGLACNKGESKFVSLTMQPRVADAGGTPARGCWTFHAQYYCLE